MGSDQLEPGVRIRHGMWAKGQILIAISARSEVELLQILNAHRVELMNELLNAERLRRITSYNVCYTKLLRGKLALSVHAGDFYGYYQENEIPVFYRTFSQEELLYLLSQSGFQLLEMDQRPPLYDFEFPSERIYVLAEKP